MMILLLLLLFSAPLLAQIGQASTALMSPPPLECSRTCGNVKIPYPFGFGDGKCHSPVSKYFNITCNKTFVPPKPFLGDFEIMDILVNDGQLRVKGVIINDCYNETRKYISLHTDLGWPDNFTFSHTSNKFVALGCDAVASFLGRSDDGFYAGGCISFCRNNTGLNKANNCSGVGCCTTDIPGDLQNISFQLSSINYHFHCLDFSPCSYAFLVERDKFAFNVSMLKGDLSYEPPVIVEWVIGNQTCDEALKKTSGPHACRSKNSHCFNSSSRRGYNCKCNEGYDGNPYVVDDDPGSCRDVDECKQKPSVCPPNSTCTNTVGSYYCTCTAGTNAAGDLKENGTCETLRHDGVGSNHADISWRLKLGLGVGVALLILVAAISCICLGFKREKFMEQTRKVAELKERLFEQNGGLFLRELIPPTRGFRIFTEEELMIATTDFDESQIAGRGGHGIVYKGRLADDTKIAIKKSKIVDERQSKEFAREIGVLSQINHVNVVKLLGCCLEVEIPMLVYEYVERGTLYDFIHHPKNKNTPISLFTRMKIATEAAEALAYLHSYASVSSFTETSRPPTYCWMSTTERKYRILELRR